ncbi:MAG: CPBP family intramembrane metalloprotease [Planctomycetales bacterium]|nr:CPBP family intramembrane metalloprotease [Planctomycetales bacterium]
MEQGPEITPEMLQANPLLMFAVLALALGMLSFLMCSLAAWAYLGWRSFKHLPILPAAFWRPRVWGAVDLFLVVILGLISQIVAARVAISYFGVEREQIREGGMSLELMGLVGLGHLVVVLVTLVWLSARYRVTPSHAGFNASLSLKHVAVGLLAAFAGLPFVYLIMALVSFGLETQYDHPLVVEMQRNPTLQNYLLGVFTAVIVAPLAEEFLFRVLIQGYLQSFQFSSLMANLLGASWLERLRPNSPFFSTRAVHRLASPKSDEDRIGSEANLFSDIANAETSNPYAMTSLTPPSQPQEESHGFADLQPPIWPAIVTGILFGLAHWDYGLSFIPLIVLGIYMGLLYRATQSIWPSLIVHFILNASSMVALGVSIMVANASN